MSESDEDWKKLDVSSGSGSNAETAVETRVQNVVCQPAMASLQEYRLSQNPVPVHSNPAWLTTETVPPASSHSISQHVVPSATRRNELVQVKQIILLHRENTTHTFYGHRDYSCDATYRPNERSCALLISGRDVTNVNFTLTCFRDVIAMKNILSEPNGFIPERNVFLVTPHENEKQPQIENIYSHITLKEPEQLILYYSGHEISMRKDQPCLDVSKYQGNSLDVSRLMNFLKGLLPCCSTLLLILDCCNAAGYVLLPMLPPNVPNRTHIQWSSSKMAGESYLFTEEHSLFTSYIISAMTIGLSCPNRDENCPICSKFRRSISQDGYAALLSNLVEYVQDHMKHSSYKLPFRDLPLFMINPTARE